MSTLFTVFLLAATPIGELRIAIPYGIFQGLHPALVYIAAIIGNMAPVIFFLWFLPWFEKNIVENDVLEEKKGDLL